MKNEVISILSAKTAELMEALKIQVSEERLSHVGYFIASAANEITQGSKQPPGAGSILICTGCGRLSTDPPIERPHMDCCPDSNYLPIRKYWALSSFPSNEYERIM